MIMKRIAFFISAFILLLITASCSSDKNEEPIVTDNNYKFSFAIWVTDFNGNNLLSINKSDNNYYIEDISITPILKKDNVTFETVVDQTVYSSLVATEYNSAALFVHVNSYGSDGSISHEFVVQWKKNNRITTDTITYEIEKNYNNISCKSIFVNNTRKFLTDNPSFSQTIHLSKMAPSVYDLLDKNNSEVLIEKEIQGLKFSFWLSDMNDKITNTFDEKDVKERGFKFNMALTNNSGQNIFIDNDDIAPSLSNVFNSDDVFIGRSCVNFLDIYTVHKIKPGETHYESLSWCSYYVNLWGSMLLPAGKYYTFFCKNLTYEFGDNYDMIDASKTNTTRKTIEIPHIFINFEVK